ncbi:MAG: hypothetical protein HKN80_09680, partial [Acidimicrobiia bacterium]|nr:hypothetical protein [Acidimicrobiia bacterium]
APLVRPLPFLASFEGEVLAINDDPADIAARCFERPSWAIVSFEGAEVGTEGGFTRVLAEHCSYVGPLPDGTIGPDGTYGEGVITLTAPNGDILRGTYADGVSTSPPPDVGFLDFFTFAGGTGSYATAAGGGMEVGAVDFSSGFGPGAPFTLTMEGLIIF